MAASSSFDILVVCTGNVCRSPVAERLLRARLDPSWPVTVASAGVGALVGSGIDAASAQALAELGVDPAGHAARRLQASMVESAGLVLTADGGHRSVIVRDVPLAFRRTFTLLEFARLGRGLPPLSGGSAQVERAALVQRARDVADRRGLVDAPAPGVDDITDPFRAPIEVARHVVSTISAGVDGVLEALGLQPAPA